MARNQDESAAATESEATAAAEGTAPIAEGAPAAAEGQTRAQVILTLDAEAAAAVGAEVGSTMKRKDYCVKRFGQGVERGPIAKELTRLEGRKVAYQIVFQATKGATKGTAPAAPEATAGEESTAG